MCAPSLGESEGETGRETEKQSWQEARATSKIDEGVDSEAVPESLGRINWKSHKKYRQMESSKMFAYPGELPSHTSQVIWMSTGNGTFW